MGGGDLPPVGEDGVAVLGSILTSAYVAGVGDRLSGSGLPAEAVDAAKQSVMAGVGVADGLLDDTGDRLVLTDRGRLLADAVIRDVLAD